MNSPTPDDFPIRGFDTIRYADTDRQGHVNNAVFATFLETGRVGILYRTDEPLADPDGEFVIANLTLEFRAELRWPGTVEIATRIASIGRASIQLEQCLFQDDKCAAFAQTVIVQIDSGTRRSKPLSERARARLASLQRSAPGE
ncbi:acyl-CoA thioesterase [Burkholderia perseverans]|uniref:acyl-CoA thioesterase n=1 Tax=Burkholderia perseverans TaxID=2615214 RepID=UPI0024680D01|nr:thioesterase family protein [Burkholderia perseverans]